MQTAQKSLHCLFECIYWNQQHFNHFFLSI